MCGIPLALGGSAHLSMCREDGALCEERFTVLVPSSVTGVSSWGRGGSWLGCQCSLRLGTGFQQWKLRDVLGTQPPHSVAVVYLFKTTVFCCLLVLSQ